MNTEQAIQIVAKQLAANAVRDIEWEEMPDIGEQDFMWLMEVLVEMNPDQSEFNEAIGLLEKRAADWLVEVGEEQP